MGEKLIGRVEQRDGRIRYVAEKWEQQSELPGPVHKPRPSRRGPYVRVVGEEKADRGPQQGQSPMKEPEEKERYELEPETPPILLACCLLFILAVIGAGIFGVVLHWISYGH